MKNPHPEVTDPKAGTDRRERASSRQGKRAGGEVIFPSLGQELYFFFLIDVPTEGQEGKGFAQGKEKKNEAAFSKKTQTPFP